MVADGRISAGHAKMLAGLKTNNEAKLWANRIIKDHLSVYEIEKQIEQNSEPSFKIVISWTQSISLSSYF